MNKWKDGGELFVDSGAQVAAGEGRVAITDVKFRLEYVGEEQVLRWLGVEVEAKGPGENRGYVKSVKVEDAKEEVREALLHIGKVLQDCFDLPVAMPEEVKCHDGELPKTRVEMK